MPSDTSDIKSFIDNWEEIGEKPYFGILFARRRGEKGERQQGRRGAADLEVDTVLGALLPLYESHLLMGSVLSCAVSLPRLADELRSHSAICIVFSTFSSRAKQQTG